jgi:hypothetical protein
LAPKDAELFSPQVWPKLRAATADLCWLLSRDYSPRSALELVGNRYSLRSRQRLAVARCSCSEEEARHRATHGLTADAMRGQELWIDGYNVLTVVETAVAGGVILRGRDGCCRDVLGIHRRYRKVQETLPAVGLIGDTLAVLGVSHCRWLLDSPVSNSGRLKTTLLDAASERGWSWEVELVPSADRALIAGKRIVATSDSGILARCARWFNLTWTAVAPIVSAERLVTL